MLGNKRNVEVNPTEDDFYASSPVYKKKYYYFDSIEDIITRLLEKNILPYLGANSIEIWLNTTIGEDLLLFKICQH